MKIRAIPSAAVDRYLKLARLPFDAAARLLPDGGTGLRPAAKGAVDAADAGIRAIVSMILGDPRSLDDGTAPRPGADREGRRHGRGHGSNKPRARDAKELQGHPRAQRRPTPHKAASAAQRGALPGEGFPAAARPAAPPARRAAPAEPRAASGDVRAAAISGQVGRTPSSSRPRRPDPIDTRQHTSSAVPDNFVEPSHEEIAARAYDLYQRGVPGDARAHWEAAKRELTSSSK